MKLVGPVIFLLALGVLSSVAPAARADEAHAEDIAQVTVVASRLEAPRVHCLDASKEDARAQAQEASLRGDHRHAADCYLQAGDPVRADRAYMKAARLTAADSSQRLAANTDDAKGQARRIREAFKRR
jgi:hypothetical protein